MIENQPRHLQIAAPHSVAYPAATHEVRSGMDECCVTNVGGARDRLVSDQCRESGEVDTYWLAV
ncbi:hypothetical protein D0B32_11025 [Paraburkholderia sp. DHOC27]|nr:hypothetical protein D0B32_11025 [Paraburkholderia sp. DHOC27]